MTAGLDRLTAALADGSAGGVRVTSRHGEPWISVPKLEPLEEPTGLQALKDEVMRRWGVLDLLDVLKNADFLTGFTDEFSSVAAYERICSEKLVAAWRARAIKMYPSDFRDTAGRRDRVQLRRYARREHRRQPAGRRAQAGERHLCRPRHRMVGPRQNASASRGWRIAA